MGQPRSNKCMNLSSTITLGQDFRDLAEIEESSPEEAHISAYWDLKITPRNLTVLMETKVMPFRAFL